MVLTAHLEYARKNGAPLAVRTKSGEVAMFVATRRVGWSDADRRERDMRVLVVDGHDVFREGLRSALDREGFELADAPNGEAALACTPHFAPDVVLMDEQMPDMSGLMATRALLGVAPDTAVVLLSMFRGDRLEGPAAEAGAFDCLGKDARLHELVSVIEAAGSSRNGREPRAAGAAGS